MKQQIVLLLLAALAAAVPLSAQTRSIEVQGPTAANLFLYLQYAGFTDIPYSQIYTFAPTDDYTLRGSTGNLVLGAGYTLINMFERFLTDFEYDFSRLRFSDATPTVFIHSFGLNLSYRFGRRRSLALGFGMGMAFRQINQQSWRDHDALFTFSLGLKVQIQRRLWLRADARFFGRAKRYWDDWEYGYEEDYGNWNYDDFGTRLAFGLEYHFH